MTADNEQRAGAPPNPPQPPAGTGSASTENAEEQGIRQELGIRSSLEAEGGGKPSQGAIDRLLGEAVVGYEEIFKGTVLEQGAGSAPTLSRTVIGRPGEGAVDNNLGLLRDVNMKVKVELGRGQMYLKDVLSLGQGSVVELDRLAGDPLEIYVNEKMIARGEVLVLNENFCIRITEIHDPKQVVA